MGAVRNREVLGTCLEISRQVMGGSYYRALMLCRRLFEFEQERLNYESQGLPKYAANR